MTVRLGIKFADGHEKGMEVEDFHLWQTPGGLKLDFTTEEGDTGTTPLKNIDHIFCYGVPA